jgi:hypothetical protein
MKTTTSTPAGNSPILAIDLGNYKQEKVQGTVSRIFRNKNSLLVLLRHSLYARGPTVVFSPSRNVFKVSRRPFPDWATAGVTSPHQAKSAPAG